MDKETIAIFDDKDEVYCHWFTCGNCGKKNIMTDSNFCPDCGYKITKKLM